VMRQCKRGDATAGGQLQERGDAGRPGRCFAIAVAVAGNAQGAPGDVPAVALRSQMLCVVLRVLLPAVVDVPCFDFGMVCRQRQQQRRRVGTAGKSHRQRLLPVDVTAMLPQPCAAVVDGGQRRALPWRVIVQNAVFHFGDG